MELEHLPKDMQEVIQSQYNEIFTNYKIYLKTFKKISQEDIERISDLLAQNNYTNAAASFYKLANNPEQLETAKATLSDPDNTSAASYFYRLTHPATTARSSAIGRFSTINTENTNMQQVERHLKPMFEAILQSPDLQSKVSSEAFLIFQSINNALHNSPLK